MHPWDDASLGRCVPWTIRPLDDATLGRCILWTMPSLDDASIGRCDQWWANLDQTPNDLDTTIFRDLSPTPIP
jgi:hypothetical protein